MVKFNVGDFAGRNFLMLIESREIRQCCFYYGCVFVCK